MSERARGTNLERAPRTDQELRRFRDRLLSVGDMEGDSDPPLVVRQNGDSIEGHQGAEHGGEANHERAYVMMLPICDELSQFGREGKSRGDAPTTSSREAG